MKDEELSSRLYHYHPFTGRKKELESFKKWVHNTVAPFRLFYVCGPGGIGKSALLTEMAQIAQNDHTRVITLDGSACLKTPTGFFEYLSAAFQLAYLDSREYANPIEPLYHADADHRIILTIDHFEQLKLIERLFINDFLPRLPDSGVAVILASRLSLPREWQVLSELGQKIVDLPLAAFTYKETVDYVESYGAIEQEVIHKLIRLSSGLPLALALLTDSWSLHRHLSEQDYHLVSQKISAEVLRELTAPELQPLVDVLTILQCANQETLSLVIGREVTHAQYVSLLKLSFIQLLPEGLAIHDIARTYLLNDLKQREPERWKSLRMRAAKLLYNQLSKAREGERRSIAAQMLTLCKDGLPLDRLYADLSRPIDMSPLESASLNDLPVLYKLLDMWCAYSVDPWQSKPYYMLIKDLLIEAPESVVVLRNNEGVSIGMFIAVLVHKSTGQLLKKYFPAEMKECFSEEELSCSLDHADTYYAVLVAAADNLPNYSHEELVGLLSLDRLIMLGEGSRAILVATNSHLKAFLQQLGFQKRPTRTRDCDTSWAKAEVLELDLRNNRFGNWAISFFLGTPDPLSSPNTRTQLTEPIVRKMIGQLRNPAELRTYLHYFVKITKAEELKQHLSEIITDESSLLSTLDRLILKNGAILHPNNSLAAAEACQMSRATYYRHMQKAIQHLTHILQQENFAEEG